MNGYNKCRGQGSNRHIVRVQNQHMKYNSTFSGKACRRHARQRDSLEYAQPWRVRSSMWYRWRQTSSGSSSQQAFFFRQVAMPLDSNAQTRKKKGKKEIRTLAESVEDPFAMIETVASDKQLINASEFRMALPVQGRISERAGSTRTMCHDFVGKISTSQTLGLCIDL